MHHPQGQNRRPAASNGGVRAQQQQLRSKLIARRGSMEDDRVGVRRRADGGDKSFRSSMPAKMTTPLPDKSLPQTRPGTLYRKDQRVFYKAASPDAPGGVQFIPCKILEVHLDDMLVPYYTILREDGVEKQTDDDHLTLVPEVEEENCTELVVRGGDEGSGPDLEELCERLAAEDDHEDERRLVVKRESERRLVVRDGGERPPGESSSSSRSGHHDTIVDREDVLGRQGSGGRGREFVPARLRLVPHRPSEISQLSENSSDPPPLRDLSSHPGEGSSLDLADGVRALTPDERKARRKKAGMCIKCGEVKTHRQGLWKQPLPETVEGLVYKGECLKCHTLKEAKIKLGEPVTSDLLDGPKQGDQATRLAAQARRTASQAASRASAVFRGQRRRASVSNEDPRGRKEKPSQQASNYRRGASDGTRTRESMAKAPQDREAARSLERRHPHPHPNRRPGDQQQQQQPRPQRRELPRARRRDNLDPPTDREGGREPRRHSAAAVPPKNQRRTASSKRRGGHLSASLPPNKPVAEPVHHSSSSVRGGDSREETPSSGAGTLLEEHLRRTKDRERYEESRITENRLVVARAIPEEGNFASDRALALSDAHLRRSQTRGADNVQAMPEEGNFASDAALALSSNFASDRALALSDARLGRGQAGVASPIPEEHNFFSDRALALSDARLGRSQTGVASPIPEEHNFSSDRALALSDARLGRGQTGVTTSPIPEESAHNFSSDRALALSDARLGRGQTVGVASPIPDEHDFVSDRALVLSDARLLHNQAEVASPIPSEHDFVSERALVVASDQDQPKSLKAPSPQDVKAIPEEQAPNGALVVKVVDLPKNPDALLLKKRTRETEANSSLYSSQGYITSSHQSNKDEEDEGSARSVGSLRKVEDFRIGDSHGDYGFYTGNVAAVRLGTSDEECLPQGRGEMVYDDGKIAKGVWSKGTLKVKVAPSRERYEPYVLPRYEIGEVGRDEDMVKATAETASRLHVGDCAFIRRSNGTWSYSVVKSRMDGDDESITFQVKPKGSTKTVLAGQWSGHVRLPARADVLPGYKVGDPGREEDMIVAPAKDTVAMVSRLRVDDAAWVRRSDGSWTYSLVIDRTEGENAKLTFEINSRGCTKSVQVSQSGRCVRRVRHSRDDSGHSAEDSRAAISIPATRAKSPPRPNRRASADMDREEEMISQPVPKDQDAEQQQQQHPAKSSSFVEEAPLQIQQIYRELDQRKREGSTASDTFRSHSLHSSDEMGDDRQRNERTQVLAIFDNRHHEANDGDDLILTDDGGSSLGGDIASLAETSLGSMRAEDRMLLSLIARRRRRAATADANATDAEDSIDGSLGSLVRRKARESSLDPYRRFRNDDDDDEGGYSSLTDQSKQSLRRAGAKDKMLMNILMDITDADVDDLSYDESLSSLRERFLNWRERRKRAEKERGGKGRSRSRRKDGKDRKKSSKDKKRDKERKKRKEKERRDKPSRSRRHGEEERGRRERSK